MRIEEYQRLSDEPDSGSVPDLPVAHHLQAYAAAVRAGDRDAALRAASDAFRAAGHLPQPHYAYGEAWLQHDQPTRAEQAFAAALEIAPRWADAWINYGIARYRQGFVEDAKIAMRQALPHASIHSSAHRAASGNLGALLRITGEAEPAELLLRSTLARDPGNAGARLNLAADLLQEERAAEALGMLEEADPTDDVRARRHWWLQQSLALLQLGRTAEARPLL